MSIIEDLTRLRNLDLDNTSIISITRNYANRDEPYVYSDGYFKVHLFSHKYQYRQIQLLFVTGYITNYKLIIVYANNMVRYFHFHDDGLLEKLDDKIKNWNNESLYVLNNICMHLGLQPYGHQLTFASLLPIKTKAARNLCK